MLILEMIVIQGLTFLALIFLLKKVLYSHFSKAMRRLQLLSQDNERKRVELQAKLEKNEKEFQAKLKESEDRAAKIREEAESQADEIRNHALAEAKAETDKLLEAARTKQEELRKELEAEITDKAAHVAADALRYVFSSQMDQGIHHYLVRDLLAELEKMEGKRINGTGEAHLVVPYALEEGEKEKLLEILRNKTKRKMELRVEIDRSVIAGMVLKLDTLILDGTLRAKIKEAVGYVRKGEKRAA